MKTKDMIREYCFMYVDVNGTFPDMEKLTRMSDYEIKILYTDMLILFKKLNKKT